MSDEILIGRWDCPECGNKGVRGDVYSCDGCSAGRPEDVEFYLPNDAEVVTDQAGIDAANAGADWKCDYCDEWVPATESTCPDCYGGTVGGAERQKTGVVYKPDIINVEPIAKLSFAPTPKPKMEYVTVSEALRRAAPATPPPPPPIERVKTSFPLKATIAAFVALLVGVGIWAVVRTSDVPATITSHSWVRVQEVEEYRTLGKEGWDHPRDAYEISSRQKEHHKRKVLDHYETRYKTVYDRVQNGYRTETYTERVHSGSERYQSGTRTVNLGNGRYRREAVYSSRPVYKNVTRTRQVAQYKNVPRQVSYQEAVYRWEPVYQTYYSFKIDRWVAGTTRTKNGNGVEAVWPSAKVRDSKQRMGVRRSSYTISLKEIVEEDKPRTWTTRVSQNRWRLLKDGDVVVLTLRLGDIVEMKSIDLESE